MNFYKDTQLQGFVEPAIFVKTLTPTKDKKLGKDKFYNFPMVLMYHTDFVDRILTDTDNLGIILLEEMEFVRVPTLMPDGTVQQFPIRGMQTSYQTVEDVLQVFVTFRVSLVNYEQAIKMEELQINQQSE